MLPGTGVCEYCHKFSRQIPSLASASRANSRYVPSLFGFGSDVFVLIDQYRNCSDRSDGAPRAGTPVRTSAQAADANATHVPRLPWLRTGHPFIRRSILPAVTVGGGGAGGAVAGGGAADAGVIVTVAPIFHCARGGCAAPATNLARMAGVETSAARFAKT